MDSLDESSGLGFDVAATLLREYERDQRSLLEVVATKLAGVLGDRVTVRRRGSLLGPRRASEVTVSLGDLRFVLRQAHGRLDAVVSHVVGDVRLRSDHVPVADWIHRLANALSGAVRDGSAGQDALHRFIL